MRSALLSVLTIIFLALHQDVWLWREARPLLFGFLPVGLTYHALYSIGTAALIALIVRVGWPAHLERGVDEEQR